MHINREETTLLPCVRSPTGDQPSQESKFLSKHTNFTNLSDFLFSTSTLRSPLFPPLPGTVLFRVAGTVTKGSTRRGEVLKFQHGPTRANEVWQSAIFRCQRAKKKKKKRKNKRSARSFLPYACVCICVYACLYNYPRGRDPQIKFTMA